MPKFLSFIFIFLTIYVTEAQEVSLPVDFRQHNLVEYNSSLFNPVLSLDQNHPESIALWTRWQWQHIDMDPTTVFLNYTRKLGGSSAVGAAFFQHNTGIFFNRGGIINYAKTFKFSSTVELAVGANLFGFNQQLADEYYEIDPELPFPDLQPTDDFILQVAPGIRLSVENFAFGVASENLLDYNFTDKGRNTASDDKIFLGMVSYDFPIGMKLDSTAFLRPRMYLRTIPEMDNQIGMDLLFSTSKYWGQMGYNNFYGIAIGGGATFFKRASLGALVEFGTSASVNDMDPSFEIVLGYYLGKPEERRKIRGRESADEKLKKAEALAREMEKEAEELAKKAEEVRLAQLEQERNDSIARAKEQEALAEAQKLEEQRRREAIERERAEQLARQAEAEKPRADERYEEIKTEDGLTPGYYLIANVFGTKKYFEAFLADLRKKGLQPKSFYRSKNKFNYVYLERYDTMGDARQARNGNFNGQYSEDTWIFRVRAE